VWKALRPLIIQSEAAIEGNDFLKASFIATALLKNLVSALDYSDDSNGDMGYLIDAACRILQVIVSSKLSTEVHNYLWAFCIKEFKANTFKDWDWHLMMMELVTNLCRDKKELTWW